MQEIEERLFLQPLSDLVTKINYFRRLERAWRVIETDYPDPKLNLERAARICGASKNHLNVMLRQTTGLTFHQLLIRYRLLRAITAMSSRNYTLGETALLAGFGSVNTLRRNFHNCYGDRLQRFRRSDHS